MFVAFWEVQRFTRELNDLRKELMQKQNQLMKHQKYASMLGGSSIITVGNLAGLSADILPRATMFAQYSDQASSMSAQNNLIMMKNLGRIPVYDNPQVNMQVQLSAFNMFKQEALKALKQQEVNYMNEIEKEIELELNSLKTRIAEKEESLKNCKELLKQQAQEAALSFGL